MKEIRDLCACDLFHKVSSFLHIRNCSCIKMPLKGNFWRNPHNVYSCFIGCEATKSNTLWMFLDSCLHWKTEIVKASIFIFWLPLTCCGQVTLMFPCYENSITSECRVVCVSVPLRYYSAIAQHAAARDAQVCEALWPPQMANGSVVQSC